jgi:rod shape-determining protein MreC
MRNKKLTGYGLIAFCLIVILSVPPKKTHRTRAKFVAMATNLYTKKNKQSKLTKLESELKKLKEENASLKQKLINPQLYPQQISASNVALVIFRDPAFWASSVLINKGMKDEDSNIEKNSPVLSNGYLIGIVEEVFDTFSKVRLITDKNLQFSIKKKMTQDLSKEGPIEVGTLCGISSVDNRYRFKNVEGHFFSPTLKPGDELVTSGLDGLFPEGLQVAVVTDVNANEEEVIFPFKAIVTAPDIKDLKLVTIIKPLLSN